MAACGLCWTWGWVLYVGAVEDSAPQIGRQQQPHHSAWYRFCIPRHQPGLQWLGRTGGVLELQEMTDPSNTLKQFWAIKRLFPLWCLILFKTFSWGTLWNVYRNLNNLKISCIPSFSCLWFLGKSSVVLWALTSLYKNYTFQYITYSKSACIIVVFTICNMQRQGLEFYGFSLEVFSKILKIFIIFKSLCA